MMCGPVALFAALQSPSATMSEAEARSIARTFWAAFGPGYPGTFQSSDYIAANRHSGISAWTLMWTHSSGVVYIVNVREQTREVMSARASRVNYLKPVLTSGTGKPVITNAAEARSRIAKILKALAPMRNLKLRKFTFGSGKPAKDKAGPGAVEVRMDLMERGYPVLGFGCSITLNAHNGLLVRYAGRLIPPRFPKVTPKPMSFDRALGRARIGMDWPTMRLSKSDVNPLGWYVKEGRSEACLAWRLTNGPSSKRTLELVIDAVTGEVLDRFIAK